MLTAAMRLAGARFLIVFIALSVEPILAQGVDGSYHAQLGKETGAGMLQKWSALYHFSFEQEGGIEGWIEQGCGRCHIGAEWNREQPYPNCFVCHIGEKFAVTNNGCLYCHHKNTEKRGDMFTAEADVHVAAGLACQDCHLRVADERSDHQFLKGTAIDTTEPTMEGTLSCTRFCHASAPHVGRPHGNHLNRHTEKIACETCHTGKRPVPALASRDWTRFDADGAAQTEWRRAGWLPAYKWYDNTGPGAAGNYAVPLLGNSERRDAPGARIYPFNAVTVNWFVKTSASALDDVIIVPEVKTADRNGDGTVTLHEMRQVHAGATLKTADMNFSISHSVLPKEAAFDCDDCHGRNAWVLDWSELGYPRDPFWHFRARYRRNQP